MKVRCAIGRFFTRLVSHQAPLLALPPMLPWTRRVQEPHMAEHIVTSSMRAASRQEYDHVLCSSTGGAALAGQVVTTVCFVRSGSFAAAHGGLASTGRQACALSVSDQPRGRVANAEEVALSFGGKRHAGNVSRSLRQACCSGSALGSRRRICRSVPAVSRQEGFGVEVWEGGEAARFEGEFRGGLKEHCAHAVVTPGIIRSRSLRSTLFSHVATSASVIGSGRVSSEFATCVASPVKRSSAIGSRPRSDQHMRLISNSVQCPIETRCPNHRELR